MKTTSVVVHYAPWRGDQQVAPDRASALAVIGYEVNGHRLHSEHATLLVDGGIFRISMRVPDYSDSAFDNYRERNIAHAERCIASVREELTPGDWLEDTTDEVLVLPVAKLELQERPLSRRLEAV